jgi:hypothetical protein
MVGCLKVRAYLLSENFCPSSPQPPPKVIILNEHIVTAIYVAD